MELKQPRTHNGSENVTWKAYSSCFKLHYPSCIPFNFSNVGEIFGEVDSRTGTSTEKGRKFHVQVMQKRQRNVQKSLMHVQSCCFANLARDFFLSVAVVVALYKFPNILECTREVHGRTQFFFGQSQFSIRLTCTQRFWKIKAAFK